LKEHAWKAIPARMLTDTEKQQLTSEQALHPTAMSFDVRCSASTFNQRFRGYLTQF
jgi:hypothetical protein